MNYYFITPEQEKQGPVTLEQLLKSDLSADTLIWHEGLDEWKRAADVEEVAAALQQAEYDAIAYEPKSYIGQSVIGLVFATVGWVYPLILVGPLGTLGIVFSILSKSRYCRGDYPASERFGRLAKGFGIAACITGIVLCVFIWICIYVAVYNVSRHSYYY